MNLNKAIIVGRATATPEMKTTTGGNSVTSFSVATNSNWKDKSGQKQEQVEFHNVVAWGRLAEIVSQYLTKGQICMVDGRIQTRSWDDQQGVKHWKTEIVAENFQLGPRSGQGGGSGSYEQADSKPAPQDQPAPPAPTNGGEEDIKVEDIPF